MQKVLDAISAKRHVKLFRKKGGENYMKNGSVKVAPPEQAVPGERIESSAASFVV
jgi:hypothetical protein